jgi:hypothetical protein
MAIAILIPNTNISFFINPFNLAGFPVFTNIEKATIANLHVLLEFFILVGFQDKPTGD